MDLITLAWLILATGIALVGIGLCTGASARRDQADSNRDIASAIRHIGEVVDRATDRLKDRR